MAVGTGPGTGVVRDTDTKLADGIIDPDNLFHEVDAAKQYARSRWSNRQSVATAVSLLNLSGLEGFNTDQKVADLCISALKARRDVPEMPAVAAVRVLPEFVRTAKHTLEGSGIKVATVARDFSGETSTLSQKVEEVESVARKGADEIDVVLNRRLFLGSEEKAAEELRAIKLACGPARMNVTLEICDLNGANDCGTISNVYRASMLAMNSYADSIKTSTGKGRHGATLDGCLVMVRAILDYEAQTGKKVGLEAAGDIVDPMQYLQIFKGSGKPLIPGNFRLSGASCFEVLKSSFVELSKIL